MSRFEGSLRRIMRDFEEHGEEGLSMAFDLSTWRHEVQLQIVLPGSDAGSSVDSPVQKSIQTEDTALRQKCSSLAWVPDLCRISSPSSSPSFMDPSGSQ